ncbi:NAD(P)/FAD-dependent oxidoreductase [Streptomyces sp. NPDC007070]|uniref:NAD(P)/FAD-dependent oxidoreductase n=1 Tax=Streptomyces sp. NPDC007070 TaxID=3154312 RepID=UPI0033DB26CF
MEVAETDRAGAYEVVVVGGGAAGLSAALVLGRARRRTLVVDAGEPRNAPSAHLQGFLSRDGMPPAELLAVGREEIARYGVELVRDRAVDAVRDAGGEFDVTLAGGRTVHARHLVVATGLKDELPKVVGLAERFGRDVLHCPYCHGWEVRDQAFGVLATMALSVHQALMVTQWSKDVTLFLHEVDEAELSDDDLRRLAAAGVAVVPGRVTEVVVEDDRLTGVRLHGGRRPTRSRARRPRRRAGRRGRSRCPRRRRGACGPAGGRCPRWVSVPGSSSRRVVSVTDGGCRAGQSTRTISRVVSLSRRPPSSVTVTMSSMRTPNRPGR